MFIFNAVFAIEGQTDFVQFNQTGLQNAVAKVWIGFNVLIESDLYFINLYNDLKSVQEGCD